VDLYGVTEYLSETPEFSSVLQGLKDKRLLVGGLNSGSRGLFLSSLSRKSDRTILVIASAIADAEDLAKDIAAYSNQKDGVLYYPQLDVFPFEDASPDKDITSQRLDILNRLIDGNVPIVVTTIRALAERTIAIDDLKKNRISINAGGTMNRDGFIKKLVEFGYIRQTIVGERGEVSVRGGIIDVFSSSYDRPLRIELVGDKVESIRFFDPVSQITTGTTEDATLLPAREILLNDDLRHRAGNLLEKDEGINKIIDGVYFEGMEYYVSLLYKEFPTLIDHLPKDCIVFLDDRLGSDNSLSKLIDESEEIRNSEIPIKGKLKSEGRYYLSFNDIERLLADKMMIERGGGGISFDLRDPENFFGKLDSFADRIRQEAEKRPVFIVSAQAGRLNDIFSEKGIASSRINVVPEKFNKGIYVLFGDLSSGFDSAGAAVFTDREIFAELKPRERFLAKPKEGVSSKLLSELDIGDHVVHINHGIGIYRGLTRLDVAGAIQEYIDIEYAEGDRLYVPLHLMGMVQKYSSLGEHRPKINRLGGAEWLKTISKAKGSIKELTSDLIEIYSERKRLKGINFPPDNPWQIELEQSFPYEETPDQQKAVTEVKSDMESDRPMDRLVCGDVGYGKTEVAIRAAFKAATSGKQVAVLVPTTVLAEQHFRNFSNRFKSFPVVIEMLSRFKSAKEQGSIIKSLAAGAIDMIIGTHRLLQDDVVFKDLGLLIVDEEQRFGVAHKEKIKKLKKTVDVLTLSATPIPRTLYMAISGAKDMSMINTPPLDRSPIKTYLYEWNEGIIHEAILRELERGGQIYFVHNYVRDIGKVAELVRKLVPAARIAVAHGQMQEKELESVMIDFLNRRSDVLVCSTIIESGIDIPSVNTIIIDGAERLGLSQLYQLRGRVGRSSVRAYAYLLYRKEKILTDTALERLKAIQEFTALGSGYKLAMKDLEIRGAGNILGPEQHGHILSIGFELYCDLLEETVKEIKRLPEEERERTYVDLKVNAFIPQDYIPDEKQRIAIYRRMNFLSSFNELEELKKELRDRFGRIPNQLENLCEIIVLKIKATKKRIASIEGGPQAVKMTFRKPYDRDKVSAMRFDIDTYERSLKLKTSGLPGNKWFDAVREIVDHI